MLSKCSQGVNSVTPETLTKVTLKVLTVLPPETLIKVTLKVTDSQSALKVVLPQKPSPKCIFPSPFSFHRPSSLLRMHFVQLQGKDNCLLMTQLKQWQCSKGGLPWAICATKGIATSGHPKSKWPCSASQNCGAAASPWDSIM